MRLIILLTLVASSAALACEKIVRTVEFLGWTADSRMYAWRVHETCSGCAPKWVNEHTFVRTTAGSTTEYLTKWSHPVYPKPELPGSGEFDKWLKQNPLTKSKPATESPKDAAVKLAAREGEKQVEPKSKNEFCASKETVLELYAGSASRGWKAGTSGCGCARGFWSPSGEFVAWLTGPANRTCDDCHGKPCCREPEALMLAAER